MRLAAIALFAGLPLIGCSSASEQAEEEAQQSETRGEVEARTVGGFALGSYSVDLEIGETRAVVNNEDGTTTLRAGERLVPRLLPGFTIYPGAEIRNTVQVGRGEGIGVIVSLASEDPPADLVAFYRQQAQAAGVAIRIEMTAGTMATIAGEAPDGTAFSFQASGGTGETTAQLTVRRGLN